MIHVVIIDDHSIVREGLRNILLNETDMTVDAEGESAQQAIELVLKHKPDVLLLDISLGGRSGLDVIQDIKALDVGTRILVLTMYDERVMGLRVMQSGAAGYLHKKVLGEELIRAVRRVCSSGRYISSAIADEMYQMLHKPSDMEPHSELSTREMEVLILIARGKRNTEIAEELSINSRTVGTYRTRIMNKMGFESTPNLVRYAINHGLIALDE